MKAMGLCGELKVVDLFSSHKSSLWNLDFEKFLCVLVAQLMV